jgi:hypothetical protein
MTFNVLLTSTKKLNKVFPEFYAKITHSLRSLGDIRGQLVFAADSICITKTISPVSHLESMAFRNVSITHTIHYYERCAKGTKCNHNYPVLIVHGIRLGE